MQYLLSAICVFFIVIQAGFASTNGNDENNMVAPPLDAFSRMPKYEDVSLSPSGNKIVFMQNFKEPHNKAILSTLEFGGKVKRVLVSDKLKTKVNWVRWVNDDILLLSARHEQKNGDTLFYATRMFSVDVSQQKLKLKQMVRPKAKFNFDSSSFVSQFQDSVVDFLPKEPDYVLIEVDLDTQFEPSVYRLNVRTGKRLPVEKGKLAVRQWMTDQQNNVRIGRSHKYDTGEITYWVRANKKEEFTRLFTYIRFKDKPITIKGFALDPNVIYYTQYKGDKKALYKMALDTKTSELVLANEDYDISGDLLYSTTTQEAIGVYDAHSRFGRHYFDEKDYEFHEALDKALPETHNSIVSRSNDDDTYILRIQSAQSPPEYLLGKRSENKIEYLFSSYPELENVDLPKHKKVTYTARDGKKIEGYLTLPTFGKAPYPTIINPHGGPSSRDYNNFDYWVAYMTSRGYAVLRPNFRGSSGFGFEFSQAQMGRWGLEMQDDITDAATYLIEEGIASREKLCIVGASYGGYAAAMATVKTPALFTCAVSFGGVSDLPGFARNTERFLGGDLTADNQLGENSSDMKARSPLYNVEKINTPLLLVHGKQDRSVPVEQSRDFAKQLKREGKNVKYVEFANGDHYLSLQEYRTQFFVELDLFLSQHLGEVVVNE